MKRVFIKVDNQLNICFNGDWYFVKKEHDKYNHILKILSNKPLEDKHFEEALSELGLFKMKQKHDFEIKNGNIFISGTKAPKVFAEIINNSLDNDVSVDYLIKFFKNIVFETDYSKDINTRKKIKNLLNSNAYCPDKRSQVVFVDKQNEYPELPFYSYGKLPEFSKQFFRNERSIEQLCQELFNTKGKSWQSYLLNEMLDTEKKEVIDTLLVYGVIFKNCISVDNVKKLYQQKALHQFLLDNKNLAPSFHILNSVFSHFTEKKIVNFFKKGFDSQDLKTILHGYPTVSSVLDISKHKFLTIKELKDFIQREKIKIDAGENFPLALEIHFPNLENIKDTFYKELGMLCVIPKDYHELVLWSSAMGNCIGQGTGYAKKATKGKTLLLGFSKSNTREEYDKNQESIHYNLEIVNGVIRQFEAKKSRSSGVTSKDRIFIQKLLMDNGLIKGEK